MQPPPEASPPGSLTSHHARAIHGGDPEAADRSPVTALYPSPSFLGLHSNQQGAAAR